MKLSWSLIRKNYLTGHSKSWKNLQLQIILTFESYISQLEAGKAYTHTKVSNSEQNKKGIVVGGKVFKIDTI